MTYYPAQIARIEARFRRRLRARIVGQQKRRRHLYSTLVKRGIKAKTASKVAFSNNKRWSLSTQKAIERAFPNKWFIQKGMVVKSKDNLGHWFSLAYWYV